MKKLNIYIIDRATYKVKDYSECFDFNVNLDYIGNAKSNFTTLDLMEAEKGDILLARNINDIVVAQNQLRPFYCGVINDIENKRISTLMFFNIFDFDFAAYRVTGTSVEVQLRSLISVYFNNYPNDYYASGINWYAGSTTTAYSYQPSENPTVTSFINYAIDVFKKYNVTIEIDYILFNDLDNSAIFNVIIQQKQGTMQFKDNVYKFIDWNFYINQNSFNNFNRLMICDINSGSQFAPTVLATYYIQEDGTLVTSLTSGVFRPVVSSVFLYDSTDPDALTYQQVAQSELSANIYSHEITFSFPDDGDFIISNNLELGLISQVYNEEILYNSILTGISFDSKSPFISLTFGNIRSTLKDILDRLQGG